MRCDDMSVEEDDARTPSSALSSLLLPSLRARTDEVHFECDSGIEDDADALNPAWISRGATLRLAGIVFVLLIFTVAAFAADSKPFHWPAASPAKQNLPADSATLKSRERLDNQLLEQLTDTSVASNLPFSCPGSAAQLALNAGDGEFWKCGDGFCIYQLSWCDGINNCLDASDEADCVPSATRTQPLAMPADASVADTAPASLTPATEQASSPAAETFNDSASASGSRSHCFEQSGPAAYNLTWVAEGPTFFDKFNFLLNDPNSGAAQYVTREEAIRHRVVESGARHAILRAGPKGNRFKRFSAKIETQQKWKYFLAALRFTHVPWGCGVWPAIWTHSPDVAWPNGGELDILEYANEIPSRSSMHVGQSNRCKLDPAAVQPSVDCPQMPDAEFNFTGDYDCVTAYPDKLGCAPNVLPLLSGEALSQQPSVVVAQWTPSFLKVFLIPEAEVPEDLENDAPKPDSWDPMWLVSYYPFAASEANAPGSCPNPADLLAAQRIVLSLGFCGDWASKVWINSTMCANRSGMSPSVPTPRMESECVAVDPHNPMGEAPGGPRDCCTQFIYDETNQYGTEEYLGQRAYFNITWLKVYQQ